MAEVRGSALRHLLIAAPSPYPGCQARLRLRGAHITGESDLAEVAIAGSIRLDRCRFDKAVRLATTAVARPGSRVAPPSRS